jgi:leader peptidase (prepilin peptidase) / N-methyltransferase
MGPELQLLAGSPAGLVLAVVLGLMWGSFANVCIYRWPPTDEHPEGRSVVTPGSHCFACQAPIRWYDNVPLLSYVWLRGRCRACGAAFSPRYLLVEALTGALFGVAWWFSLGTGGMHLAFDQALITFVVYATVVFVMVVITFIDIDHLLILNKVTYPAAVLFYAFSLALGRAWWEGLVGAVIGYGVPWLIGKVYYWLRERDGMGLGDSTMLAMVGALFGWQGVVVTLFGGSLLGTFLGTITLLRARRRRAAEEPRPDGEAEERTVLTTELPFGPYLAAAAVFYLFAEPWIRVQFRLLL